MTASQQTGDVLLLFTHMPPRISRDVVPTAALRANEIDPEIIGGLQWTVIHFWLAYQFERDGENYFILLFHSNLNYTIYFSCLL